MTALFSLPSWRSLHGRHAHNGVRTSPCPSNSMEGQDRPAIVSEWWEERCLSGSRHLGGAGRYCVEIGRSEEHTSELQSLMRISYAVFCLKKKKSEHTRTKSIKVHELK